MTARQTDASLTAKFDGRVARLHFPAHASDSGRLTPLDFAALPLVVVRAFVVNASDGALRGGHAHRTGRELLVCLAGEIEVELQYGEVAAGVVLDATRNALMIAAPVWSRQRYHGSAPSLLVLSDTAYDPRAYEYDGLTPPNPNIPFDAA